MSQFIVSARKYRPQLFAEVVGQEHITTTLKNAIRQNKVAHAFLFCGPRGVGKTTTARILARTINCENITDDFEACGKCESCIAFHKKNTPNIMELDAASHNSVDDIRTLNEQVRIPPAQGTYKLFIIDEVHMLSTQAFNAFLKTLEEPPPFAIFILATTEKHKILPTILSRCQIYDFKRNKVQDIIPHLEKICEAEGLKYDKEALHLIGEKADGALRDALSIFDRMVSFSDGNISYEAVIDQLNILDYDYFFRLTDYLITGDLSATYLLFDQILEKGFSPEVFLMGFQEHLRQLLMIHLSDTATLVNASPDLQRRYVAQAENTSRDFILTVLDLSNECDMNYRFAQNKRLHVEITLMKMAYFPYAITQSNSDTDPTFSDPSPNPNTKKNANSIVQAGAIETPQPLNITPRGNQPTSDISPIVSSDIHTETTPKNRELENDSSNASPKSNIAENKSKKDSKPPQNVSSEIAHTEKSEIPDIQEESPQYSSRKLKKKSKNLLPTLNAMEDIIEEVEQNDAENQFKPEDDELIELVQSAWNDYIDNHSSPSLISYLKDARLEWKDEKLYITVTSQLAKSSILDQRPLFENLRQATSPHTPEIVFEIDQNEVPEHKATKILSTKDKYEALRKANPRLDHMIRELNLKIDDI